MNTIYLFYKVFIILEIKVALYQLVIVDQRHLQRQWIDCTDKATAVIAKLTPMMTLNTLRLRQDGRHFPDDILKCIFLNENV